MQDQRESSHFPFKQKVYVINFERILCNAQILLLNTYLYEHFDLHIINNKYYYVLLTLSPKQTITV